MIAWNCCVDYVEELAHTLAQDLAYQDYEQTRMLLGTCGEQIPLAYQKVAPIQEAYKDQMVKTAIAMVQPGETASLFFCISFGRKTKKEEKSMRECTDSDFQAFCQKTRKPCPYAASGRGEAWEKGNEMDIPVFTYADNDPA